MSVKVEEKQAVEFILPEARTMKIFQIVLTKKITRLVNEGKTVPEYSAYLDGMLGREWNESNSAFYSHVANYSGEDLEQCFEALNLWNDDSVELIDKCRSLSVGDICIKDNGEAFQVAPFGFNQINFIEGK